MLGQEIYFKFVVLTTLFTVGITRPEDGVNLSMKKPLETSDLFHQSAVQDHYPLSWTQIDTKAVINNERLFKKYKECLITDHAASCPRMVTEFKSVIPEMIETLCAKCLPAHIEKFKDTFSYICHHRRDDFDEIRREKDPDGTIQEKFEEKFGKMDC